MRSESKLSDQVPFSFEDASIFGFSIFPGSASRDGILAIGHRSGYTLIVVRVPPEHARQVRSSKFCAYLRDGSILPTKGFILQISPNITALADKVSLTAKKTILEAGGQALYLTEYVGPITQFDEFDRKLVAAFDGSVDWESISKVEIGEYNATVENGAKLGGVNGVAPNPGPQADG